MDANEGKYAEGICTCRNKDKLHQMVQDKLHMMVKKIKMEMDMAVLVMKI